MPHVHMKKIIIRSVAIALILTAAVAFIVWYNVMRRTLPEQARVIPADAFAVLTVNMKELAADRSGDDHLYPEMKDESIMQKELQPFLNALEENGSPGFDAGGDALMFCYHSGEAGFFGITVALDDSAAFGRLIRVHVAREYNIQPWTQDGVPVVRFDTTAAVIGWTEDAAVFLYPLGNHGIATVSTQCIQLLKQSRENSVLSDENFCAYELQRFDMALWIQTKPLLHFTGGGAWLQQTAGDIQYFNYFADFAEGQVLVRSEWFLQDNVMRPNIREIPFPCESNKVRGFVRTHLDVGNDTMYDHYADSPPLNALPLNDEECAQLLPYLTGDCVSLTLDTVMIQPPYPIADSLYPKGKNWPGNAYPESTFATSYQLSDAAKATALITTIMNRDSIPLTNRGWIYTETGLQKRVIISGDLLTVTNNPLVDGRGHPVDPELGGYMAWFDLHTIFAQKTDNGLSWFIPSIETAEAELSEQVVTLHSTIPVQVGNIRRSEIVLQFANTRINALVQCEEILRKIYFQK